MADIPTRSFATIVQTIASGIQGRAKVFLGTEIVLDFTIGSVLRSMADGIAGIMMWVQAIALQIAKLTRSTTSEGEDLDSYFAGQWDFVRLGGTSATGTVTFSRISVGSSAPFIPLGATVASSDGTQEFTVVADLTNPYYTGTPIPGYTMPSNVASITIPVQAAVEGTVGNIVAGALTQITTPLVGIDAAVNAAPFTNGANRETDAAYRTRFLGFIAALQKGTKAAIIFAVNSLQNGLQATVLENVNADGSVNEGFVTVTVDDGSGTPPDSTIEVASAAVESVIAASIVFGVFPPVVLSANTSIAIVTAKGYDHNTVVGVVAAAVTLFVNTLPLGASLYINKLAQTIFEASPGVTNITTITINDDHNDIEATDRNTVKLGTLTVV